MQISLPEEIRMRRLIIVAALLFLWTLPAHAQPYFHPFPFPIAQVCCQKGVTYGASTYAQLPSCSEIPIFGTCTGGTVVSGTCQADGACGGSTVCCAGVSIYQACTEGLCPPSGPCTNFTAEPDSCAVTTESACDAKSAAGEVATQSYAGGTCVNNGCSLPAPPIH